MDQMGQIGRAGGINFEQATGPRGGGRGGSAAGGDRAHIDQHTQALMQAIAAMGRAEPGDGQPAERVLALRQMADEGSLSSDSQATAAAMVDEDFGA